MLGDAVNFDVRRQSRLSDVFRRIGHIVSSLPALPESKNSLVFGRPLNLFLV